MATGGRESGEESWSDDFRKTCSLCMEPYRGRTPKLLPCFHTFCLSCLTTLAASAVANDTTPTLDKSKEEQTEDVQQMEGDSEAEKKTGQTTDEVATKQNDSRSEVAADSKGDTETSTVVFLCPTCRSPVTVPEGGVENLQTNFYLDTDEEISSHSGPVLCDVCEEGEKQDATHYCNKCQQNMCRVCRRLHDKYTDARTHKVQPVQYTSQQPPTKKTPRVCAMHPDHNVCLHCTVCDVSICMLCKLTLHESHATEDMAAATLRAKEELKGLLQKVMEQVQVVQSQLSRLDRDKKELTRQRQDLARDVNGRFDLAMSRITRARDELMESLVAREETAIRGISAEQAAAQNTLELLTRLATRSKTEYDLVSLRNEVRSALLSDGELDACRKTAERKGHLKFFTCSADTAVLEQEVANVFIGELQDDCHDEEDNGVVPRTLKLTQLPSMVMGMDAEMQKLTSRNTQMDAEVQKLTSQNTQMGAEIQRLTSQNTQMDAEIMKLTSQNTQMDAEIKQITSQNTQMDAAVSELNNRLDKRVFFTCSLSKPVTTPQHFWSCNTVKFNNVTTNEGNCYNSHSGVFTAPCSGIYIFHASAGISDTGKNVRFYIQPSRATASFSTVLSTPGVNGHTHLITRLDKQETAEVTAYGGGKLSSGARFAGALIQADADV